MRREYRESFLATSLKRNHWLAIPACIPARASCMSGSLNRGNGENVPGIPGACATHKFKYLAKTPLWGCIWQDKPERKSNDFFSWSIGCCCETAVLITSSKHLWMGKYFNFLIFGYSYQPYTWLLCRFSSYNCFDIFSITRLIVSYDIRKLSPSPIIPPEHLRLPPLPPIPAHIHSYITASWALS